MDRTKPRRTAFAALVTLFLIGSPALAGCSDSRGTGGTPRSSAASMPATSAMAAMAGDVPIANADAVWSGRPDFANGNAETEQAYAFAVYHPQILKWFPCYCGCAGIGHRSNLDCYLKPVTTGSRAAYEEHASYCDVCVKITLKVKSMFAQGSSLRAIRQAVDETFGGGGHGTPTDLPPA